mmetsp:Transcript_39765/g.65920  ORF Transcript_39765/g.65920 Transcript_39765/m.65920 type:complete len:215 (-) Transcript_39765:1143-1787(-)
MMTVSPVMTRVLPHNGRYDINLGVLFDSFGRDSSGGGSSDKAAVDLCRAIGVGSLGGESGGGGVRGGGASGCGTNGRGGNGGGSSGCGGGRRGRGGGGGLGGCVRPKYGSSAPGSSSRSSPLDTMLRKWAVNHTPALGALSSVIRPPNDSFEAHSISNFAHRPPEGSSSVHPSDSPGVLSQKNASTASLCVLMLATCPSPAPLTLHQLWQSVRP